MLKKLRRVRNDEKGFTLVELIVVLVILAILAALLIPALTGYIDKAKEKQIVAETRQVVMAAQTLADEQYAMIKDNSQNVSFDHGDILTGGATRTDFHIYADEIAKLAEVDKANFNSADDNIKISNGVVTEVKYTSGGKTCTYTESDGQYAVTATTP